METRRMNSWGRSKATRQRYAANALTHSLRYPLSSRPVARIVLAFAYTAINCLIQSIKICGLCFENVICECA